MIFMKILIVKTSSLGDIIHGLPALNDALTMRSDTQFDWLVEEAFCDIPALHPKINHIIPIALRRWRKNWLEAFKSGEIKQFIKNLRHEQYDLIIDLQGLIKSALPALLARGAISGFDKNSIKERLASLIYQQKYAVNKSQHAIFRNRHLMAQALNYKIPQKAVYYGLKITPKALTNKPYLIFLHGTTWKTKFYPESYWIDLLKLAKQADYAVYLPMLDQADEDRAKRLIKTAGQGILMEKQSLTEITQAIAGAAGVIGLDSGLAHLAAALNVPAVTLYGATDTKLTGAMGQKQKNLQSEFGCSPCFKKECPIADDHHIYPPCFQLLPAPIVWQTLQQQMA